MQKTIYNYNVADLRENAKRAYSEFEADDGLVALLDEMGELVDLYERFIRSYLSIEDKALDTDDEIINWTFPDVIADLSNSLWNIACGYHKASVVSLRNAYELTAISLTFQIEENTNPSPDSWNKLFTDWDTGREKTPNWHRILNHFSNSRSFVEFGRIHKISPRDLFYAHYSQLCSYTHSRPFDPLSGLPTNTTNMGWNVPFFDRELFIRFLNMVSQTISLGSAMWLITYPQMLTKQDKYGIASVPRYSSLFLPDFGREAFTWITGAL